MTEEPEGSSEQKALAARRILSAYKRSGYGTSDPRRYTPVFSVADVILLAHAVLHG